MGIINKNPSGGEQSLASYLKDLGPKALLTPEQEVAIAKRIEEGKERLCRLRVQRRRTPKRAKEVLRKLGSEIRCAEGEVEAAKNEMIRANLRLVISIAKKYAHYGLPLSDLIQEGNIGLMRAVEKFDYHLGHKFSTYAFWWIRQAMTRSLSDRSRTIRIPVHVIANQAKLARAEQSLRRELGREPTPEECAEEMSLKVEQIERISQTVSQPISLDGLIGDEEDSRLEEFVADPEIPNPGDVAIHNNLSEQLMKVLTTLTPREEKILRMRFGIGEESEYTLEEVGRTFRVTRERIRQIEEKALQKLRCGFRGRRLQEVTKL